MLGKDLFEVVQTLKDLSSSMKSRVISNSSTYPRYQGTSLVLDRSNLKKQIKKEF